jgi:hypothetical protein
MKIFLLIFLAVSSRLFAQGPDPSPPAAAPESGLRPRLYEVAGALGNEGFKLRDGVWSGVLQGSKPQRLALNLFAGNQYWFCAVTSSSGESPSISLRDPAGQEVGLVPFKKDGVAAAGVTAAATGRYVLEIGGSARGSRDFCILYLFK